MMKKVDILNFITDYRKAPNQVKTHQELLQHLGTQHESTIQAMLAEMKQLGVSARPKPRDKKPTR